MIATNLILLGIGINLALVVFQLGRIALAVERKNKKDAA